MTPLHNATKNGHFDIALRLLYSGSIVDARDIVFFSNFKIGRTSLFFAIKYNHSDLVFLLLYYNASVILLILSLGLIKIIIMRIIQIKIIK